MNPTSTQLNSMDDDEISLLLAEPDAESRGTAFEAIVTTYWKPLCCLLDKQGIRNLSDQEDIVAVALRQFHGHAMNGISLEEETSFRKLLFTIVKRRGRDFLRKRGAELRGAAAYEDYVTKDTLSVLRQEHASASWVGLTADGSAAAIMEDFRQAVPTLPPQQEAAARAVSMLLDTNTPLKLENIRASMEALTGTPVTSPAAKSAWAAVRSKFREVLRSRRRHP